VHVTVKTVPPVDSAHRRGQAITAHVAPVEPRALGVLAILALLAIISVILPIGAGLLMGAMFAFTVSGYYRRLVERTRRPALIAAALATTATALVAGTLGVLVYLLVLQGVTVAAGVPGSLAQGGATSVFVHRLSPMLEALHIDPNTLADRLRDALGGIASSLAGWAARIVGIVADGALALFFMATTMYFVLRHGTALGRRAERLMPINPHHTRRLMRALRRLGRTIVIGNFGTALLQGIVAGVGFAIAQVPQAAFLGAITAVASLIPAFGTMLVWLPIGVVLLAGGHTGMGIFELAWSLLLVVGVCDYVVRPRLVGNGETMSTWMTFVALFGGIKLFGFIGFLLGPLLVGIALAALRLYERTRRFQLGAG
jgi:predicted PurR-regulated permease PerM